MDMTACSSIGSSSATISREEHTEQTGCRSAPDARRLGVGDGKHALDELVLADDPALERNRLAGLRTLQDVEDVVELGRLPAPGPVAHADQDVTLLDRSAGGRAPRLHRLNKQSAVAVGD